MRGKCQYYGEVNTHIGEFLKGQGFSIEPQELDELSKIESQTNDFYMIHEVGGASPAWINTIDSLRNEGHTVVVWTKKECATDWCKTSADLVLADDFSRTNAHLLEFAIKVYDERTQYRESEFRLTRTNDDLRTTIDSLEIASRRFEALFSGLPVGCFTFDSKGMIHEWNSLASQIFGIEGYEAFLNHVWDVLDPDGNGSWSRELVNEVFQEANGAEFDWQFVRDDGVTVYLACKIVCLTNRRGDVVAAVAGNLDITARVLAQQQLEEKMRENRNYLKVMERQRLKLQEANRQLRRLAVTDGLTSLTNRRRFNELIEEVLDRAIRQNQTFSVLMFDIDHFKSLNDVFGHQAGDEILEIFAQILRDTARRYERPARYGGEEFVIILDNCDRSSCMIAAERFRNAINNYSWPYRDINASIGCSTFSGIESVRDLIEQADLALYESKKNGRNRVTHSDDVLRESRETKAA